MRIRVRIGVSLTDDPNAQPGPILGEWPPQLVEWEEQLTSTVEVLAPQAPLIELTDDSGLESQVKGALTLAAFKLQKVDGGWRPDCVILGQPLPIDLAFKATVRCGDRTWDMGEGVTPKGMRVSIPLYNPRGVPVEFPRDAIECDIILKPDVGVAERSVDLSTRIFGGEIVLERVPIEWNE